MKALRDKNPRVRLQAVIGLARLGQARKSLLKMAAAPVDNSPKNRVYANNEIIPHIARKALVETDAAQICLDGISMTNKPGRPPWPHCRKCTPLKPSMA